MTRIVYCRRCLTMTPQKEVYDPVHQIVEDHCQACDHKTNERKATEWEVRQHEKNNSIVRKRGR
jgi:hypothetical protein